MIKSRLKPMAHQQLSLKHDETTDVVFDMSDPGTGKTAVRAWAWAKRRRKGGGPLLVLAPRSLLTAAWAHDLQRFAPDMKVSVATAANREKAFSIDADAYITNHDAAKWLVKQKPAFWQRFRDGEIVNDESTAYKHHTSQRAKAAFKIAHMRLATKPVFKHRACLTATPTSNGICDIWHQVALLDGGKRLGPSFYAFRNSVCTPVQVGRSAQALEWRDKDGAEDAVFGLIDDYVVRHRFEDCVDIPATHTYTVEYEMTPKQRKAYDDMELAQVLATGQGKGIALTAVNAAAVTTKLCQIASGAVYDNDKKYHLIDGSRYEAILDMAQVRKHPIVFFYWGHQRNALTTEAETRSMNFAVIDGDASDTERNMIVQAYQAGAYDVLFAHPKSAAHGLTLTAGTSIIWSGPTYDLEWWKQGNRRQARIGQKKKTEIVVCLATNSIEERIYHEILMPKDGRMKTLLELFATNTERSDPIANKIARELTR
jgi:SNF2 family DNA or RNA helicase